MAVTATALTTPTTPEVDGIWRIERYTVAITNTPTIAAGAAAGASPTVAISGNDVAGTITITTGTTALGSNGILATVTFANTMSAAPIVILYPANDAAFELLQDATTGTAARALQANVTTTTFVIRSGDAAPADSTAYVYNYVVRNARTALTVASKNLNSLVQVEYSGTLYSQSLSGGTATLTVVPDSTSASLTLRGR